MFFNRKQWPVMARSDHTRKWTARSNATNALSLAKIKTLDRAHLSEIPNWPFTPPPPGCNFLTLFILWDGSVPTEKDPCRHKEANKSLYAGRYGPTLEHNVGEGKAKMKVKEKVKMLGKIRSSKRETETKIETEIDRKIQSSSFSSFRYYYYYCYWQ